jgi:hypothetical protein
MTRTLKIDVNNIDTAPNYSEQQKASSIEKINQLRFLTKEQLTEKTIEEFRKNENSLWNILDLDSLYPALNTSLNQNLAPKSPLTTMGGDFQYEANSNLHQNSQTTPPPTPPQTPSGPLNPIQAFQARLAPMPVVPPQVFDSKSSYDSWPIYDPSFIIDHSGEINPLTNLHEATILAALPNATEVTYSNTYGSSKQNLPLPQPYFGPLQLPPQYPSYHRPQYNSAGLLYSSCAGNPPSLIHSYHDHNGSDLTSYSLSHVKPLPTTVLANPINEVPLPSMAPVPQMVPVPQMRPAPMPVIQAETAQMAAQTGPSAFFSEQDLSPGYLEKKLALGIFINSIAPTPKYVSKPNPRITEIHDSQHQSQHQESNTTKTRQVPMGQVPMGQVPMGPVPMGQVPMGQVPMGQVPMGPVPQMRPVQMGQVPMEPAPMPVPTRPAPMPVPMPVPPMPVPPMPVPPMPVKVGPAPMPVKVGPAQVSQVQMPVQVAPDQRSSSTNTTLESDNITGFIKYLNETNANQLSSETREKEVSSKTGEDKELIEGFIKYLNETNANQLSSETREKEVSSKTREKEVSSKTGEDKELIEDFIKYLNETNANQLSSETREKEVSSKTREKEVSSKTGEDKELIEDFIKFLSNVEKKEKDAEDKNKNLSSSSSSSLVTSKTNKDPITSVAKPRTEALMAPPPSRMPGG